MVGGVGDAAAVVEWGGLEGKETEVYCSPRLEVK